MQETNPTATVIDDIAAAQPANPPALGGDTKPFMHAPPAPAFPAPAFPEYAYHRPVDPILGEDYSDEEEDALRFGRFGAGRRPRALAADE